MNSFGEMCTKSWAALATIRGKIRALLSGGLPDTPFPSRWAGLSIIAEKIARECEYRRKDKKFVWPPYAVRACVANPVNFRLRQDLKCKSICIHSHPTGPPHWVFQPVGTRQQRDKSICPSTHLTIRPTVEATPILPVRRVSNVCGFGILGNREHACQAGAFGLCG
jgi:hypothetical protein